MNVVIFNEYIYSFTECGPDSIQPQTQNNSQVLGPEQKVPVLATQIGDGS